VDGHRLPQDRVQALHLIPRQHAEPPTLIRRITARHGEYIREKVEEEQEKEDRYQENVNERFVFS